MSLSKSKLRLLSSLKYKKFREKENLFVIEGEKILLECLFSNWKIVETYLSETAINKNSSLINALTEKSIPILKTSSKDFRKFSSEKTPSEIAALVEMRECSSTDLLKIPNKRFILLEDISDPGNLGTIIRSADWFGVNGIILDKNSVEITNPKVIKASMGSIFHLPIIRDVDLDTFCSDLKSYECKIFSTAINGKPLKEISFPQDYTIIFGSESLGVSRELQQQADEIITLPSPKGCIRTKGKAESLNVAIAASIILYETSEI